MPAPDSRDEGTWAAIQRVRARWEADYSQVAKGGVNALIGFEYQFMVALRDTVRCWLNHQSRNSEPKVFTEILSDVHAGRYQRPRAHTQVKRTQSGRCSARALSTTVGDSQTVIRIEPVLVQGIGYRIVSARPRVADVTRSRFGMEPSDVVDNDTALRDSSSAFHVGSMLIRNPSCWPFLPMNAGRRASLRSCNRWSAARPRPRSRPMGSLRGEGDLNDLVALSAALRA